MLYNNFLLYSLSCSISSLSSVALKTEVKSSSLVLSFKQLMSIYFDIMELHDKDLLACS